MPMVQMFHTLGHMKNRVAKEDSDREADVRIQAETEIMGWADRLVGDAGVNQPSHATVRFEPGGGCPIIVWIVEEESIIL